jgi:hypothetical protein
VFSRRHLLALLIGLAGTACQPVPQPFSHTETGSMAPLDLPDSGGIVVFETAAAPAATATALAEAMAKALADRNVPAATGTGNSQSHFLQSGIEDDGQNAAIVWSLYDPAGALTGTVRQSIEGTPIDSWVQADPALMTRLAVEVAPQIAALVQGSVPDENTLPALRVAEISGAPGRGNQQLRFALERHLAAFGQRLTAQTGPQVLNVTGTVTVDPPSEGQQRATLDWRVIDANGVEVGKIVQSNPVTAGSLDGSWGNVADFAAQEAAAGINDLVRRINWRAVPPATEPARDAAVSAVNPPRQPAFPGASQFTR